MTQETIAVPVELVRKLKAMTAKGCLTSSPDEVHRWINDAQNLVVALPDPPDVVEECAKAAVTGSGGRAVHVEDIGRALRRYRELRGLPPDPELEE